MCWGGDSKCWEDFSERRSHTEGDLLSIREDDDQNFWSSGCSEFIFFYKTTIRIFPRTKIRIFGEEDAAKEPSS